MDKNILETLKEKLEKEKSNIEKNLQTFAKKDDSLADNWNTKFPTVGEEYGSSSLEKSADEVEEYSTLLPIEHSLELKLKDINIALKKMENGKYGICEKCRKEIPAERLTAVPEAKTCTNCQK